MISGEHFHDNYLTYWKERVTKPLDGSKVADLDILDFYIRQLEISEGDKVLDLGCGFGRSYPAIAKYTQRIVGIDISRDMLLAASEYPYDCIFEASAEHTLIADCFFNHIFIWGTYDVVNQEKSLIEFNRILRTGGRVLVTGKNYSYDTDDEKAFIAERNAKLKNFPNHFTDVSTLRNVITDYGFKVHKAYAFKRRGDLGENKYINITDMIRNSFYEYVLILEKTADCIKPGSIFAFEFSKVATMRSRNAGFDDVCKFFPWHHSTTKS